MTPQEIVAILFDLMNGRPWKPQEDVTIQHSGPLMFLAESKGDTILFSISPPYPKVTAKFFLNWTGKLKGVRLEKTRLVPLIDGLPDIPVDF